MAVAKTYEKLSIQGEPFKENGRMYIYVIAAKGQKKVRWYSDAEYKRMYPEAVIQNDIMDFDARHAFGFGSEGYITIYKGRKVEEWANEDRTHIYFNLSFGYYTPGRFETPHLIEGITPIKLTWEEVAAEGNKMRPHAEVCKYVNSLLSMDNSRTSQYQGTENEWLQKEVTIREKTSKENRFGTKHTYFMADTEGNTYVWETGAKDYKIDETVSLKMKVKEHKEINDEKVTVVWYCKEV